ncbi:type I toxin-antitoxin system Ibs family toxin [Escherichia coli]|nr:type I toxin-antitoxin system Ibs family toxin [Escherichia coli]
MTKLLIIVVLLVISFPAY